MISISTAATSSRSSPPLTLVLIANGGPSIRKKEPRYPTCPAKNRFLRLPGELRNVIYDFVILQPLARKSSILFMENEFQRRIELRTLTFPALATTCRQIQKEALCYLLCHGQFMHTIHIDQDMRLQTQLSGDVKSLLDLAASWKIRLRDVVFRLLLSTHIFPRGVLALNIPTSTTICRILDGELVKYDLPRNNSLILHVDGRHISEFWKRLVALVPEYTNSKSIDSIAQVAVEASSWRKYLVMRRLVKRIWEAGRDLDKALARGGPSPWDCEGFGDASAGMALLRAGIALPMMMGLDLALHTDVVVRKRWKMRKMWHRVMRPASRRWVEE